MSRQIRRQIPQKQKKKRVDRNACLLVFILTFAKEVLHSRQVDPELHTLVKGLMIESYIEPGNQKIGCDHIYGKSITDPCLGWEESEKLLYTIAEMC